MIGNRYLSLFALLLVLFNANFANAQNARITDWQQGFEPFIQDISSSPENVLFALKNILPEKIKGKLQNTQYEILLSSAYQKLGEAEEAIKHANISLELIDSDNQPWLYHKAQLALAMALLINGEPEKGLSAANAAIAWGEKNRHVQLVIDALFVHGKLLNSLADYQGALRDQQGAYQLAFELLEFALAEKQKKLSQQSSKQLSLLLSEYEIEVRDRENKLLEQENRSQQSNLRQVQTANSQLLLLFGSLFIICVLLATMAYRAKQHRARLEEYANTDGLTGLLNRRRALEMIELQFEMAKRHQFPISLAIADIDLFKKLNDTYGHALGDKVLVAFGDLCKATFRKTDIVGRIGGEEFVIVLPHTDIDDAEIILTKLSGKFKQLASTLKIDKLSISCGLARFESNLTISEILLKCDQALYNAKHQGRDQVLKFKALHSNVLESHGDSSAI